VIKRWNTSSTFKRKDSIIIVLLPCLTTGESYCGTVIPQTSMHAQRQSMSKTGCLDSID